LAVIVARAQGPPSSVLRTFLCSLWRLCRQGANPPRLLNHTDWSRANPNYSLEFPPIFAFGGEMTIE
jgi:hypothetical protein